MNSSSIRASSASVDSLVFDFLLASTDAVLQERRAIINPIVKQPMTFRDSSDFCRQSLHSWKKDLNKPLILEIYIFDPRMNKHYLMERWKFEYVKSNEVKEARQLNVINRRILTLLRSLYCFVRLMPGFNLINISQKPATLSFQLFEQTNAQPSSFSHEYSHYKFTPVSTSKGALHMSVRFITSQAVKDILTSLNGGALNGVASNSRRNSRTAEENVHTAAIPIPSQHDPSQQQQQQDHRDSREKDSFTGGKHMNARMSTPISYGASQDATAENSSVSSSGGSLGAALGAVGMGTTPPLGSRFPRPTSTRDRDAAHRRSFHLPPHAEHGETAGYGEREDGRGSPVSHGYPPLNIPPYQHQHQQQQQQGGWSGKHELPTHRAVSLDSQPHTLQNMIRATADAVSATNHSNHSNANTASSSARPAAGSHRSSPLSMQQPHYQYQQQQQAQQQHQRGVSADGSHGGFPQPSQGIRIASTQQQAPGTSYGNSYSTPPFSLSEIAAHHAERYSGTSAEDLLVQESPPYPAFSTSLTSTSPQMPSTVMALVQKRSGGAAAYHHSSTTAAVGVASVGYGGGHSTGGSYKGRISPTGGLDFGDLKLHIAPLPSSPFAHLDSTRGNLSSNLNTALVTAQAAQASQAAQVGSYGNRAGVGAGTGAGSGGATLEREKSQSHSFGADKTTSAGSSLGRSLGHHLPRNDSNNTLDAVLMQESQRRRLDSGEESDLMLPRLSSEGQGQGEGRQHSKDRSSVGSRDDHSFDFSGEFEEEMPFAWAESEFASSGSIMPAVADSVGAQLLYGMSKMSMQQAAPHAHTHYNQHQQHVHDEGQFSSYGAEGASRHSAGNSSYTGAGLSGELLGKINDFKQLSSTFAK